MPLIVAVLSACTKSQIVPSQAGKVELSRTNSLSVAAITAGAPNDPNIKYFGRWDTSNASQYIANWGGAYLKVKFTGTTVKVKVGRTSNYYAKIDNGSWVSYKGVTGTINLTPTPLASGTHTVAVAQGKDYDYIFNFQGLIFDSGATTSAPSVGTDLIEYIGDSITAGYTDDQADVSDYAWVTSEQLGTEHTQIAYPGIALVTGYGANASNKTGMEQQYFKAQDLSSTAPTNWDFSRYTPKIIVVNLTQNDGSAAETDSLIQAHYAAFLASIRTKFSAAQIFVLRTFSGVRAVPTEGAVNARIAAGDTKIHYIDTNGWLIANTSDYTGNSGVHPSVAGHIKVANKLAPILAPYLTGGTPPVPYVVDNCDATTSWTSQNTLTLNTTDKKEGTASLQTVGSGTLDYQKHFTAFNPGATTANGGTLQFWLYVSDVTKLSSSNQIELGSGGNADINEYNWNVGTLVNGWNFISKTFSSAGTTGGAPNVSALNWFRVYHAKTGSITVKIDGIKIIHQ